MNKKLSYRGNDIDLLCYDDIKKDKEDFTIFIETQVFPFSYKRVIDETINLRYVKRMYINDPCCLIYDLCLQDILSNKDNFIGYNTKIVIAFDSISDMVKNKLSS